MRAPRPRDSEAKPLLQRHTGVPGHQTPTSFIIILPLGTQNRPLSTCPSEKCSALARNNKTHRFPENVCGWPAHTDQVLPSPGLSSRPSIPDDNLVLNHRGVPEPVCHAAVLSPVASPTLASLGVLAAGDRGVEGGPGPPQLLRGPRTLEERLGSQCLKSCRMEQPEASGCFPRDRRAPRRPWLTEQVGPMVTPRKESLGEEWVVQAIEFSPAP